MLTEAPTKKFKCWSSQLKFWENISRFLKRKQYDSIYMSKILLILYHKEWLRDGQDGRLEIFSKAIRESM